MLATAKLFPNGNSQAVRLPKEYRFNTSEVGIARVGKMVILYPQENAWDIFDESEPVTEDFCKAIAESRQSHAEQQRLSL